MIFPYGEWVILFLTLSAWAEKRASRCFFLILTIAWLIGKLVEIVLFLSMPLQTWHWHIARLGVMLVFWIWALRRTKRRLFPLLLTSLIFCTETLFLVNEPGVFPYVSWAFALVLIIVAWLSTKSYWGTAAALTGGALLNQVFVRFTYDGIIRYIALPNEFIWNLGVGLFTVWAGLGLGWQFYTAREQQKRDFLVHSSSIMTCESPEEREIQ